MNVMKKIYKFLVNVNSSTLLKKAFLKYLIYKQLLKLVISIFN